MARSAEGIVAESCVPLMYVVVLAAPFQRTTEVLTKSWPVTSSVKSAGNPAGSADGLIDVSEGLGLFMVKVTAFEVPPPGAGLKTVT